MPLKREVVSCFEIMENTTSTNTVVKLQTNDENQVLELSEFELFEKDSFKCRLKVWSRGFGFEKDVFFDNVHNFIDQVEVMASSLSGEAVLKEEYHDHYLKFQVTKLGHVIVSGTLIDYSHQDQHLEFGFKTDQTCLEPFSKELKQVFGC